VPELKIGVQISSLGMPLRKGLETASRLGAHAVELDARQHVSPRDMTETGLRQLKKLLADLNLKVCALGFRTHRGYNVIEHLQERIEATKQAMSLAYRLGANVVVNQIGRVPDESAGEDWDLLVDVLSQIGRHAHHSGAFLAAETGSESGADFARLIKALPEGSIGITLDPGNLIINNYSPAEAVESLGESIMYVHAKDGVRDLARGRGVEVPLGRGSSDFPALLGALEEHAYRGYFTVERENATDPVAEVGAAIQYLKHL
jgi:sugar phosphate isomerase/epimerase